MCETRVEYDPVGRAEAHRITIDCLGIVVFGYRPETLSEFSLMPIDQRLRAQSFPREMRIPTNEEIEIRQIDFGKFHDVRGRNLRSSCLSQHPCMLSAMRT